MDTKTAYTIMAIYKNVDYFNDRLPNEITREILSGLEKMDLKRTRLTCKRLASIGGQILVVNLYLSPREKDMQVFDAITQHPDLKKSVKNIIFDTAYFEEGTSLDYVYAVRRVNESHGFENLGQAHSTIKDMYVASHAASASPDLPYRFDSEAEELTCHPVMLEGYRRFILHAQEHGNILLSSWYDRAFEGLKKIGQIKAAVMGNSWKMIYCPDLCPLLGPDESEKSLFHYWPFSLDQACPFKTDQL